MSRDLGSPPTTPAGGLSPQARTAISIALFLQIAVVLIVVFARSGTGMASGLQQRLRESVPGVRQYAQLLHNDLGYNYQFTQGAPEDDDCVIEVELKLPDGSTQTTTIPDPKVQPPVRFQREKMLAFLAGMRINDPDGESAIPVAVAQRLIDESGATGGKIRVRRHAAQSMEDAASVDKQRSDPNSNNYWSTLYEAQILLDENGIVNLLKKASALEAAPAARPAAEEAQP